MKSMLDALRSMNAELPVNEVRELTDQFYVTLEAYYAKVKGTQPPLSQEAFDSR